MTTTPNTYKTIKQGATFYEVIPAEVATTLGIANLVGVEIASSIVTNDAVEHHLTVEIPDPAVPSFILSTQTPGWKIGDANWDIKFTLPGGRIIYSNTVLVQITRRYTT